MYLFCFVFFLVIQVIFYPHHQVYLKITFVQNFPFYNTSLFNCVIPQYSSQHVCLACREKRVLGSIPRRKAYCISNDASCDSLCGLRKITLFFFFFFKTGTKPFYFIKRKKRGYCKKQQIFFFKFPYSSTVIFVCTPSQSFIKDSWFK